jgi:hypothetical protein
MNEIPILLFIFLVIAMISCLVISKFDIQLLNIVAGTIAVILSYLLSKISINGLLVWSVGDITSSDAIITDTISVTNLPMSYLFLFFGLIALLITINNILIEIKYNLEPDIEGDFDL